jgi:hypothetical protein
MFLIFGIKRFGHKKVGYGKDFCNSCQNEAVVERYRWFSWIHIFFIPLIPVGYYSHTRCTICTNDPNAKVRTPIWQKGIFLIVIAGLNWVLYQDGLLTNLSYGLVIKLISMLMFIGCGYWIYKGRNEVSKKERRKQLTPVDQKTCIMCEGDIVVAKKTTCSRCKLEVF